MEVKLLLPDLSDWNEEFYDCVFKSNSLCFAIFSEDMKLIYANNAMTELMIDNPVKSFINPTLEQLFSTESNDSSVFEGFLTLEYFTNQIQNFHYADHEKSDKSQEISKPGSWFDFNVK